MSRHSLLLAVLLAALPSYYLSAESQGFDEICRIYTEAQNANMNSKQLSQYIFTNVRTRINDIRAKQTHVSILQLTPEKRYAIFKEGAEYSLKREWNCKAVKDLMG